jgi:hypothetical protein
MVLISMSVFDILQILNGHIHICSTCAPPPPPITGHKFECTAAHILRTAALACAQSNGSKPCDRADSAAELAVSIASLPYLNKPNAHVRSAGYDYQARDGVVAATCGAEGGNFVYAACVYSHMR